MNDKIYTAAIIIIGDEILSGRTQDKNTVWLAERLNDLGVRLQEVRVIPDVKDTIIATVNLLRAEHDYVFTTGGIGPTHDDITAMSIAEAFGVELVLNDKAYQELLSYYKDESEMTPARQKMAYIPAGGALIENPVSGAPGIHIGNVYIMAGVPRIMQSMFDAIAPTLKGGAPMHSKSVTCALPESVVADDLAAIQHRYLDISIGSYPKYRDGRFFTNLVLRGVDRVTLERAVHDVADMVKSHGDATPEIS